MKMTLVIIVALLLPLSTFAINGSIEYNGDQEILNLWGSNYSMGYAHGYLLNDRIVDLFVDGVFNELGLSPYEYNFVHQYYWNYFTVPAKYITEAKGIFSGLVDYGTSIFIDTLGRDLDTTDLLIINSIGDIGYVFGTKSLFGCSSLSSWGDATSTDTLLNGGIIMGRNLDFTHTQLMLDNALLMTFDPDDAQSWVCFGYPGSFPVYRG